MIPFNRPYVVGSEIDYIKQAIDSRKLSGDGEFNKKSAAFLKNHLLSKAVYITPSCTASSEMASLIADISSGDEVIMPSFTFASTANAVAIWGGVPVFVDVRSDTMNIDENLIEAAITDKTKAIAPVHYAGVACDMDKICRIAEKHGIIVIADAAQALFAEYKGKPVASYGDMSAISFHETKNIISGEGGALIINSDNIIDKAEIIREKGTDRSKFFRGEIDKYSWIEKGSSYLLSELSAAYLYAQLEEGINITKKRLSIWDRYYISLKELENKGVLRLPIIPNDCTHNAHIFYLLLNTEKDREDLRLYLKSNDILAVSHYVPLHSSKAGKVLGRVSSTMNITDDQSARLLRLPLFTDLKDDEINYIVDKINEFFNG